MHTIDLTRGGAPEDDSVAGAMRACHERIRGFMLVAMRLASGEPAPDDDVASAAAALVRYFTEALPRHAQDEDESLRPRLEAAGFDGDLGALEREHHEIDAYLARLLPAWQEMARQPSRRAELAGATSQDVADLGALFERHLSWEEAHLIPRLEALLGAAQLAEIRLEMKARRDR